MKTFAAPWHPRPWHCYDARLALLQPVWSATIPMLSRHTKVSMPHLGLMTDAARDFRGGIRFVRSCSES